MGDREGVFRLQAEQMRVEPSIGRYNALKASAEKLGKWSELRPALIAQIEEGKDYGLLTHAYMLDESWDKAWATLPKISNGNHIWANHDSRLEIDLAEKTLGTHPEKALPVLINYAHELIDQRNRESYRQAAGYFVKIRDAYDSMDEFEEYEKIIKNIRGMKPRLTALLEELKKVGL
jgi:uncharacterized Zn finger protein